MTTVGIASIPAREKELKLVLDSLTHQVDFMVITLNGYNHIPEYLNSYSNAWWQIRDNNRGDAMKFYGTDTTEGIYLCCDDDLIYPSDYVEYMISGVNKYNGLVSLHGRTYLKPIRNFKIFAGNYRCLNTVSDDVKVNFIGSGCCAFHTDRLRVFLSDFPKPNMADCYLSRLATEQGVPMVVLKHAKDYLTYTNPKETIWRDTRDFSENTKILQSFIK